MESAYFAAIALILGLVIGAAVALKISKRKRKRIVESNATIVLKQIQSVCKLVTVEGNFAEFLDQKETKPILLGLMSVQKKAVLKITAKAVIGFDLSKVKFEVDRDKNAINITHIPEPELIAVEPEIYIHDVRDQLLFRFRVEDYNKALSAAKSKIKDVAMESELPILAKQQAMDVLTQMKRIALSMGWSMDVDDSFKLLDVPKKSQDLLSGMESENSSDPRA